MMKVCPYYHEVEKRCVRGSLGLDCIMCKSCELKDMKEYLKRQFCAGCYCDDFNYQPKSSSVINLHKLSARGLIDGGEQNG